MTLNADQVTVFGTRRTSSRTRIDGSLRSRAQALRADVADALGVGHDGVVPGDPDDLFAPDEIARLARRCVEHAQAAASREEACARELFLLALDLHQLALDIHQEDLSVRTRRLSDCADGLERLRGLQGTRDLLNVVCQEMVSRCGFERVVLSRVENGGWTPMTSYFAEADDAWLADWRDQSIPLNGLTPEARLLTERRPALVHDTSEEPVHRDIIVESGQATSYVVAPLLSRGSVVGFLHADYFPSPRRTDEVDRDVLWAFADGFTRIHERMVLLERVRAQRTEVSRVLDSTVRAIGAGSTAPAGETAALVAGQADVLSALTSRENQVLRLIVGGATNRAIADELVITEDTVKSHVKQVLRKLGVANRAQAIARAAGTAASWVPTG